MKTRCIQIHLMLLLICNREMEQKDRIKNSNTSHVTINLMEKNYRK